jgi:hypothetical protein
MNMPFELGLRSWPRITTRSGLEDRELEMEQLLAIYRGIKGLLPSFLKKRGAKSSYEAAVFRDVVYAPQNAVSSRLGIS